MADQTVFRNSVFTSNASTPRIIADWIDEQLIEGLVSLAGAVVIRLGQDMRQIAESPLESSEANYKIASDIVGENTISYPDDGTIFDDDLSEVATSIMIDRLHLVILEEDTDDAAAAETAAVLQELGRRQTDENDLIEIGFGDKLRETGDVIENNNIVESLNEIVGCGLRQVFNLVAFRRVLSPAARSLVRACSRRNGDGTRISREIHEYNYCRTSGAIEDALTTLRGAEAEELPQGFVQALDNAGVTTLMTYGQFVDCREFRRYMASRRKVRRSFRSAGVVPTLDLVGADSENIINEALEAVGRANAIDELNDKFNMGNS